MAYYYMHPDLSLPEDASVIWRYMELCKFQSMLQKNSLFFSRADEQEEDKLEGEYPGRMLAELESRYGGIPSKDGITFTFHGWHTQKERRSRLISCWNLGPSQSRRMWTEYTQSSNSIAVRSTIERLKNCFHEEVGPVVWIGKVRYGEEEDTLPNSIFRRNVNFWLYPFLTKRGKYRWENEIRAIVNIALARQAQFDHNPKGCNIRADLQILIDSVWLHPQAPAELRDQVRLRLENCNLRSVEIDLSPWDACID